MVVIRLARGGAKKRPFYNIVVANSRKPRDGRYIERIGYFNPVATGSEIRLLIEKDRIAHWTSMGAQPSARVLSLLKDYEEMVLEGAANANKEQKQSGKKEPSKEKVAKESAEETQE